MVDIFDYDLRGAPHVAGDDGYDDEDDDDKDV